MGAMPHCPWIMACQDLSTPVPRAVTSPVPVTTTRRFDIRISNGMKANSHPLWRDSRRKVSVVDQSKRQRAARLLGLLVRVDVVDGVAHGLDVLRLFVGDLDLELLFHRHHQLND